MKEIIYSLLTKYPALRFMLATMLISSGLLFVGVDRDGTPSNEKLITMIEEDPNAVPNEYILKAIVANANKMSLEDYLNSNEPENYSPLQLFLLSLVETENKDFFI